MFRIQDVLNPSDEIIDSRESSPNGSTITHYRSNSPPRSTPRQDRAPKDGFVDVKGIPRSNVRYPPHEVRNDPGIGPHLDQYKVRPDQQMGRFVDYPRYIPYTSAKRDFLEKTGMKGFNVFQYEFMIPDESNNRLKRHLVLWEYQVGLVRITPFFKALYYSKTTPKKALDLNEGLADITRSITGGSLAAQGYWMPFECAKAIALTFCYPIRHLLTPVFGRDFVDQCLSQDDPAFASFQIDPSIIHACARDMDSWRQLISTNSPRSTPGSPSESPWLGPSAASASSTPLSRRTLRAPRLALGQNQASDSRNVYGLDNALGSSSRGTSPQISPKTSFFGSEWTANDHIYHPDTPPVPLETMSGFRRSFSFQRDTVGLGLNDLESGARPRHEAAPHEERSETTAAIQRAGEYSIRPRECTAKEHDAAFGLLKLRYGDAAAHLLGISQHHGPVSTVAHDAGFTTPDTVVEQSVGLSPQMSPVSQARKRIAAVAFEDTAENVGHGKKPARGSRGASV